jgi:hypothetical protein
MHDSNQTLRALVVTGDLPHTIPAFSPDLSVRHTDVVRQISTAAATEHPRRRAHPASL